MDECVKSGGGSLEKKQCDVAYAMTRGEHSPEEILEAYGVTEEEFVGWVCGGQFPAYAAAMARGFAETRAAYIWSKLMELARDGNVSAMRLYLDFLYRKPSHGSERAAAGNELGGLRESIFGGDGE